MQSRPIVYPDGDRAPGVPVATSSVEAQIGLTCPLKFGLGDGFFMRWGCPPWTIGIQWDMMGYVTSSYWRVSFKLVNSHAPGDGDTVIRCYQINHAIKNGHILGCNET